MFTQEYQNTIDKYRDNNNMTKEQAIEAIKAGLKVQHRYFTDNEYLEMLENGKYKFEDGNICNSQEFWSYRTIEGWFDGWSLCPINIIETI